MAVCRGQAPGGGELGEGLEHPGDEGGEGKVAVAAAFAVQEAFETELAAETEEGGDMPMGQGAANGEGLAQRAKDLTALEQGAGCRRRSPGGVWRGWRGWCDGCACLRVWLHGRGWREGWNGWG